MRVQTKEGATFSRVVRLGTIPRGWGKKPDYPINIYCHVQISAEGELSISGVEGPLPSGNAMGSCGQIDMHLRDQQRKISLAKGWTRPMLARFFVVWQAWHLNNMRANCQHQIGPEWDPSRKVDVHYYELSWECENTLQKQTHADMQAQASYRADLSDIRALRAASKYSAAGALLLAARELGLKSFTKVAITPEVYERTARRTPNWEQIADEIKHTTESKGANWLRPDEHPQGFLCKPCAVCGYKYGSEWKRETLPADVVEFLGTLPETDKEPAWV